MIHIGSLETFLSANAQLLSLPISLLSLNKAASLSFFSQRLRDYEDPSPPLKTMLPIFVIYIFVTVPYVLGWSFIASYLKGYFLALLGLAFGFSAAAFAYLNTSDKLLAWVKNPTSLDKERVANIKWRAVFMSVYAPCVVGHHKLRILFVSSITTTASLVIGLIFCMVRSNSQSGFDGHPPITSCIRANISSTLNHTHICRFQNGTLEDCQQVSDTAWFPLRLCDKSEECGPQTGNLFYL